MYTNVLNMWGLFVATYHAKNGYFKWYSRLRLQNLDTGDFLVQHLLLMKIRYKAVSIKSGTLQSQIQLDPKIINELTVVRNYIWRLHFSAWLRKSKYMWSLSDIHYLKGNCMCATKWQRHTLKLSTVPFSTTINESTPRLSSSAFFMVTRYLHHKPKIYEISAELQNSLQSETGFLETLR